MDSDTLTTTEDAVARLRKRCRLILASPAAAFADPLVASDRVTDNRGDYRPILSGRETLACGCPGAGPVRPDCFVHDQF